MTTEASDINDLFMSQVSDYTLTNLYNTSASALNTYLEPWLLLAIDDFNVCTQDLTFTVSSGSVEGFFTETLVQKNKNILSQIMTKYWLAHEVQDIIQMRNFLQDRDFRRHSAAQNLRAKKDFYNAKKEELSQILVEYGFLNEDWVSWKNQVF